MSLLILFLLFPQQNRNEQTHLAFLVLHIIMFLKQEILQLISNELKSLICMYIFKKKMYLSCIFHHSFRFPQTLKNFFYGKSFLAYLQASVSALRKKNSLTRAKCTCVVESTKSIAAARVSHQREKFCSALNSRTITAHAVRKILLFH